MEVRDAVEADAEDLAAIVDMPTDVVQNVVHDRTVRVAEQPQGDTDPNVDLDSRDSHLLGFVSFDARDGTVYITQLAGSPDACRRLLTEPVRFAANEGMDVEFVVSVDDEVARDAAETAGFEERGSGPTFEGRRTVRYRLTPA